MSGQAETGASDALLKRIISDKRQRLRKNVHILFLGLTAEEADPIITLLRGARLAPRGQQVQTEEEFNAALSERSWDLILSPQVDGKFTAREANQVLQRLNKDIPIIQLVPKNNSQKLLQGLKARMATVISLDEKELLLIQIRRQLEHLENRRQLHIAEAKLAEAEIHCQQLAVLSELAISYLSYDFTSEYINPAFCELFGLDENAHSQGEFLDKFIATKSRDQFKASLHEALKKDQPVKVELTGRRVDGTNFQGVFSFQHARYLHQDCLQIIINPNSNLNNDSFENFDPTTRLYDRDYMINSLEKAVHKALPGGADCSLLYIKFDNYRSLQSELGTTGSDIVLADVAELFRNKINKAHICARLDGGVFSVLFHDPEPDKALKLADLLCQSVSQLNINVAGTTVQTSCSIGICTINDNAPHFMELLNRARIAADAVGTRGQKGNGTKLFELTPDVDEDTDNSAIDKICKAMDNDQFRILFQPIVGLTSSNGLGHYEVFLRLNKTDDDEGIVPNVFITTMDHAETSIRLDKWVIEHTFAAIADKLNEQQRSRVFINLTARFYQDSNVLNWVADKLNEYRIPADLIAFQVSESDLSTSLAHAESFRAGLRKLGCKFCIKHYGVSANRELLRKNLKPDLVKLDGSYIHDLSSSTDTDKTFATIIKDLKKSNIITIAPLVEDTSLMGRLWKLDIDYIQGNYLQPPGNDMDYDFFD